MSEQPPFTFDIPRGPDEQINVPMMRSQAASIARALQILNWRVSEAFKTTNAQDLEACRQVAHALEELQDIMAHHAGLERQAKQPDS